MKTLHPLQLRLARSWWNSVPTKKRIHFKTAYRLKDEVAIATYWFRQVASKAEADQVLQALKEHYGTN